jgi:hypothetical protein
MTTPPSTWAPARASIAAAARPAAAAKSTTCSSRKRSLPCGAPLSLLCRACTGCGSRCCRCWRLSDWWRRGRPWGWRLGGVWGDAKRWRWLECSVQRTKSQLQTGEVGWAEPKAKPNTAADALAAPAEAATLGFAALSANLLSDGRLLRADRHHQRIHPQRIARTLAAAEVHAPGLGLKAPVAGVVVPGGDEDASPVEPSRIAQ